MILEICQSNLPQLQYSFCANIYNKFSYLAIQSFDTMSDIEIEPAPSQDYVRQSLPNQSNNVAQQIINNSVFRMLLKDLIEEHLTKKQKQDQQFEAQNNQDRVNADAFMDEIGEHLMMIAKVEASKQIKQAEKFLTDMYQHKIKELEHRFQDIMESKVKEFQQKIQKMEEKTKNTQSSFLSPIRVPLKSRPNLQISQQINRRIQLKERILNSTICPQARHSLNLQAISNSLLSQSSGSDPTVEKLTQKIKQLQQNFKMQIKTINQKMTLVRSQTKTDLQQTQVLMKQQLNAGFEGIWNVISNLQKRMII